MSTPDNGLIDPGLRQPSAEVAPTEVEKGGPTNTGETIEDTNTDANVDLSPQSSASTKPISQSPPASPTSDSDDDEFEPRGKVTQTIAGGGKRGGRPG